MLAVAFDTHAFVKRLRDSGIPETQAEAHVSVLQEVQQANLTELATKVDIIALKTDMIALKTELKADMQTLKADMQTIKGELRMAMADIRAEMKVLKLMQGVSLAGIAGLMTMMIKFLMHQ